MQSSFDIVAANDERRAIALQQYYCDRVVIRCDRGHEVRRRLSLLLRTPMWVQLMRDIDVQHVQLLHECLLTVPFDPESMVEPHYGTYRRCPSGTTVCGMLTSWLDFALFQMVPRESCSDCGDACPCASPYAPYNVIMTMLTLVRSHIPSLLLEDTVDLPQWPEAIKQLYILMVSEHVNNKKK